MNRVAAYSLLAVGVSQLVGCVTMPIHTGQLVREMTDLERLAEFPEPSYKTVQFSSYDRRSSLPGGPDWYANSDGFGGEEIPGFEAVLAEPNGEGVGEYLICDVEGPGAIVRTWTAAIGGDIRVYLDSARKPLYDGPAADFLLSPYHAIAKTHGDKASVPANLFRQREAAYCPIPFAKSCRMIWVGKLKEVHFYHVQIRRYEPGTAVRTFDPEDLAILAEVLDETTRILTDPALDYPVTSQNAPVAIDAAIQPHEKTEVLNLDGPQALERLTLKVEAPDLDRALRQTLLHIYCDGHRWGQVQAPIGDFFGAAPGINPLNSLPFTVAPDGTMTCRYLMPFESSLKIELDNRGEQPVTVTGSVLPMDYEWNERSMHFRARWRVDHGVLGARQAVQDMPFLIANGVGRYVGSALMLLNPCHVSSPYGGWWGEGDEKVFVDDDTVPSTFGTGSEDYFNYAWSVPDIFEHAYCGQPRNDGYGNRGFVTNYRWHILDDLPFSRHLAFYLELFPHDQVPDMSYARIGYYYARPETMDDHVAITDEDLRVLELPASWEPVASLGMHDSVYHQAEDIAQPGPQVESVQDNLRAGGKLLQWHPEAVGEELELRFSVSEAGNYRLHLGLALNAQSGRITTRLDGKATIFSGRQEGIDLYVPYRVLARQFATDAVELSEGEHTLKITFEGAADTVSDPTIGIDFLAVQRQ
ncbi:MAG: DUF2961 domain-containing protein [Phycisphaerales bacterium]|nr:MAG: DUF2961 domain-containing protein [Phycisphaerales bacterium]